MPNAFDPNVGGMISRPEAEQRIERYDTDERRDKNNDTRSVFFGKDFLQKIIDTDGASGISFFLAKKLDERSGKEKIDLIMVPTSPEGKLLWPEYLAGDRSIEGAYDRSTICPPDCP
jgi:hypothetical protein